MDYHAHPQAKPIKPAGKHAILSDEAKSGKKGKMASPRGFEPLFPP